MLKDPNTRIREKKIGKFYALILEPQKNRKAILYVRQYDKKNKKFIRHRISEYNNSPSNQHALSIYNATKTVEDVRYLLDIIKSYKRN